MHVFTVFASLVALVSAETFLVTVGKDNELTYNPSNVTAKKGDTVAFRFKNGIDSGFLPVAPNATEFPQWSFSVQDDSTPLWFYCDQGTHCRAGMVFALNPTAQETYDTFKATAMGATPPAVSSGSSEASGSVTANSSPVTLSGSLTTVSGTATNVSPSATSSGNSSSRPNGAISMDVVEKSGLIGLMVVFGTVLFLV
ncbi:hypothetical protein AN958_03770 [Leucoagaricus sp. SymC.cos]|nr:hypothetical protein AN958_03770 [Leucoagaricus sp. SymC.cos]